MVEQIRAIQDFDAARFRAFWKELQATLTGRPRRLPSMDAVLAAAGTEGRSFGGVHEIPLNAIVGSAAPRSKTGDFDPGFLPVTRRLRNRWTRIYREMVEGDELPPIDVYKVGEGYYVIDGHHRVSVARNLGRETINARVIEVHTRAPLGTNVDPHELLRAAEYAEFLESTELHRMRPQARLECSRLGRYDEIFKHILGHRYFLGLERGQQVSLPEAAASWYDNVYTPIAEVIREHRVLEQLPGWTEADVYVEITRRWLALSQAGKPAGPHPAAHALLHDAEAMSWWQRRRSMQLGPERRRRRRHTDEVT
ncbi:MAG TPA: ParB N-terminal domain-containing protein [Candidatus Dormibacteraeota bacterium]|nr:ParB N-terminal domain-containing protein [Candidatus Dormibacteraeota bacterium]